MAISAQRPYYIICKSGTRIPSDIQGHDRIEYDSYLDLERKLKHYVIRDLAAKADHRRHLQASRFQPQDRFEANWMSQAVITYPAQAEPPMRHKFGGEVDDKDALDGKAWLANFGESRTHLLFGPYQPLPAAGEYRALFRMKARANPYASDPIITLDVCGASHADRRIYAAEFREREVYRYFGLDFVYRGTGDMEYRVLNTTSRGKLWVDCVVIIKLPVQQT